MAVPKRLSDQSLCTENTKQYAVATHVQSHCNYRNPILLFDHSTVYKYITLNIYIGLSKIRCYCSVNVPMTDYVTQF